MKKYLSIITFLIFVVILNAQHRNNNIYFDAFVFANDIDSSCVITYKIPYNNLLFKKNGVGYLSGITLNLKISSPKLKSVYKSISKSVFLNNYKQTKSKSDYLEGLVNISLSKGKYKLEPTVLFKYQKHSISLKEISIKLGNDSLKIDKPILVSSGEDLIDKMTSYKMLSFGKIIPFSSSAKMFLVPIHDSSVTKIKVSLFQNKHKILEKSISNYAIGNVTFHEYTNGLFVNINSVKPSSHIFSINNIEKYVDEGKVKLIVSYGDKSRVFDFKVQWLNKPIILKDVEYSILLIEKIWGKLDIDKILRLDDEKQYFALKKYLSKYDTDSSTKFNEVMAEFYNRVDYAIFNFGKGIDKNNALSDMGKTYIKYGKPDSRKRVYSKKNNVLDIWNYIKPKKEFVFVDKIGLGNYTLIK